MTISAARRKQLDSLSPIPEGRVWLVVAEHVWGKDPSLIKAVQHAAENRSAVSYAADRLIVFHAEPKAYVDEMGALCYHPANPESFDPKDPNKHVFVAALGGTKAWREQVEKSQPKLSEAGS